VEAVIRPKLVTFRAVRFHGENPSPDGTQSWTLETKQTVELAVGTSPPPLNGTQASVQIALDATARSDDGQAQPATFSASYEAVFAFPPGTTEAQVTPLMAEEPYQYGLVSQVFPLAMTLFRRELQTLGFDARGLPLGI